MTNRTAEWQDVWYGVHPTNRYHDAQDHEFVIKDNGDVVVCIDGVISNLGNPSQINHALDEAQKFIRKHQKKGDHAQDR